MTEPLTAEASSRLLDRVRKLLAKAEDESVTQPEAEALTEKAAELMAKYGIDQALLASTKPVHDKPGNRMVTIDNPYGMVKSNLFHQIATAVGCSTVRLTGGAVKVHVFGFQSDLERLDVLYTSVLLQMASQLRRARPATAYQARHIRAWRRSWMLGFSSSVSGRIKAAEQAARAAATAEQEAARKGPSVELVVRDRSVAVQDAVKVEYPQLRTTKVTYSGGGYRDGYAAGQQANIGGTGVSHGRQRALNG